MKASRPGSAIVAVLLLVAIGVVMAASVLATADAAAATARGEAARTQARALAWSGVQGLMAELAEQRDAILNGDEPQVTPEWDLYTLDDGTRAVIRLADLTPEASGMIASESAKLDLNSATAGMLSKLPGLDAAIADRIVAARSARPFSSMEQLLEVEGVRPDMLYGHPADETALPEPLPLGSVAAQGGSPAAAQGLTRFLTVFAFDPNIQLALDGESDFAGRLRVNLNQPWSDRLGAAIKERMGEEAVATVKGIMTSGQKFTQDSDIVHVLRDLGASPEDWATTLDLFTTSDGEFLPGRVDVNLAPAEVLACLPGLTPEKAAQIVQVRQSLDAQARRTPVWLVTEGVLTPDEFEAVVDFVTTRSAQWRARIEVGFETESPELPTEGPMTIDELSDVSGEPSASPHLAHHMVVEAVLDIGSTRPRVAYLREVTLLDDILARAKPGTESGSAESDPSSSPTSAPDSRESGALSEASQDDEDARDGFGDLDLGLDEPSAEETNPDSPADAGGSGADEAGDSSAGASGAGGGGRPDSAAGGIKDGRIGRWTTRQGGKS